VKTCSFQSLFSTFFSLDPVRVLRAVLLEIANDDTLSTGMEGTKLCLSCTKVLISCRREICLCISQVLERNHYEDRGKMWAS